MTDTAAHEHEPTPPSPPPPPPGPTPPPTPGPLPPPPPRRSHGCLWGCLIAAGIALAAIIGVAAYTGWFLTSGFKDNDTIKAATTILTKSSVARSVLGDNIEVESVGSYNFSTDLATGKDESYVAKVKGSKGEGTLDIKAKTPPGGVRKFTQLILTGPDGKKYNLLMPAEDSGGTPPPAKPTGGSDSGGTPPTPPADEGGTGGDNSGASGGTNGEPTGDEGGSTGGSDEGSSDRPSHGGSGGNTGGDSGSSDDGQSHSEGRN